MKFYILFFFLFFNQQVFSQTFEERELKTSIEEVTVYLQGGLLSRTGKIDLPTGKSILKVKSLSPHIDDKSINVKATGNFTILSVNHRLNYLNRLQTDARVDSLKNQIKKFDLEITKLQSRLEILSEKQNLLDKNKKLGGETSGATLNQIREAVEFYDKELSSIKAEEIDTKIAIGDLKEEKASIEKEISDVKTSDQLPTGEIEIRIDAPQRTNADFKISYLVSNSGWFPKYDVRVTHIDQPLILLYKADVYQNTGVDWVNIKLKLSNGNPRQSGVAPELQTWYLNFARNNRRFSMDERAIPVSVNQVSGTVTDINGEPLPGANIMVKGSTIGTAADRNGNYSLTLPKTATHLVVSYVGFNVQEVPITSSNLNVRLVPGTQNLSEVVVSGYAVDSKISSPQEEADHLSVTTVENQTTVEFEVEGAYSIQSNNELLSVDLNSYEIEAGYEYQAVPKLEKDAFLIAKISNWDQYKLLQGEANLYFEDSYVGRTILDASSLRDTLNLSLGRDKGIVIDREKISEYSKRRTIGSNKIESRGFKILARNSKSQPITLILFDQIPLSVNNDISVSPQELSNGKLDEKTGLITWRLELKPKEMAELNLNYEVKYPKDETVYLE